MPAPGPYEYWWRRVPHDAVPDAVHGVPLVALLVYAILQWHTLEPLQLLNAVVEVSQVVGLDDVEKH